MRKIILAYKVLILVGSHQGNICLFPIVLLDIPALCFRVCQLIPSLLTLPRFLFNTVILALHSLPYAIFSPLFLLPLRSPLPEARQQPLSVLL